MFDISSWEILVIAVVALVVIGPEKFAGLIRNAGRWIGQARRVAATVREEIKNEIDKAEELKKLAEEQKELVELHKTIADTKETIPVDFDGRQSAPKDSDKTPS